MPHYFQQICQIGELIVSLLLVYLEVELLIHHFRYLLSKVEIFSVNVAINTVCMSDNSSCVLLQFHIFVVGALVPPDLLDLSVVWHLL